jgi:hypothetical protein
MSHQGIESFSTLQTPSTSSNPLSQAAYPADERVSATLQDASHPPSASTNLNASAPNSQDTHVSSSSKASGVSQLVSDSSSLSSSSFDTASTSPISLKAPLAQKGPSLLPPSYQIERPITPEVRNALKDGESNVGGLAILEARVEEDCERCCQGANRREREQEHE